LEIFQHRHEGKDLAPLHHLRETELDDLVRLAPERLLALENDLAARLWDQTGNDRKQGGLARAVRADDGDDLALLDAQRDIRQRLNAAVIAVDVPNREQAETPLRDKRRRHADRCRFP